MVTEESGEHEAVSCEQTHVVHLKVPAAETLFSLFLFCCHGAYFTFVNDTTLAAIANEH